MRMTVQWPSTHKILSSHFWLQLTLEQCGVELSGSTYTPIFFNSKYYSIYQGWLNLRILKQGWLNLRRWWNCRYRETLDKEGWGPTISYVWAWRVGAPNPLVVQASTVFPNSVIDLLWYLSHFLFIRPVFLSPSYFEWWMKLI